MVADHAPCLKGRELPDGQHAALFVLLHEGVEEVGGPFLVNDVQQGMQSTIGVPQGEDRVDGLSGIHLMDLLVHAPIAAVHIRVEIGRGETVVEGGVEYLQVLGVAAADFYLAEFFVPCLDSLVFELVEAIGHDGFTVLHGALNIDGGDADVQGDALHLLVEVEDGFAVLTAHIMFADHLVVDIILDALYRFGRDDGEGAVLIRVPCVGATETIEFVVTVRDAGGQRLVAMGQVDDDAALALLREGVAVHGSVLVGGELHLDAVVQSYLIIAGSGLLIAV